MLDGDDARHLTRVLRVEAGQRYEISDNRDVYLAEIETAHKDGVVFRTLEKLETPAAGVRLTLCAALVKFDRFEWMIEKATELGVADIVPFAAARSERRIALESSQQSRRAHLPEVREPVAFESMVMEAAGYRYALDEEPGGMALGAAVANTTKRSVEDSVALLIGPEGGWTEPERVAFVAAGWTRVSLGSLILRSETAAVAGLAVLGSVWSQ
jgi:16S rRNA (uracil1498-N3)-methyltransferase